MDKSSDAVPTYRRYGVYVSGVCRLKFDADINHPHSLVRMDGVAIPIAVAEGRGSIIRLAALVNRHLVDKGFCGWIYDETWVVCEIQHN